LKTTTQLLVCGIVIALGYQPVAAAAGLSGGSTHVLGLHAVSQAPGGEQPSDNRREADELLGRARQAIKDGQFDQAESLVRRAEGLPVRYGPLALGDTPQKVRADLDQARRQGPERLSVGGYPGGTPQGYPGAGAAPTAAPPAAAAPAAAPGKADCDRLLVTARQALANGDIRRAKAMVSQAEGMRVSYGVFEDSPAKVAAAVDKFEQVAAERTRGANTETTRRRYAESLMEQAEAMMKWNMLDDAERLANDAKTAGVRYNAFEATPDKMLDRITEARRAESGSGPRIREPQQRQPQVAERPSAPAGGIERLPSVAAGADPRAAAPVAAAPNPQKQQAVRLTQMASEAFAAGDLDKAERLAREARSLNVAFSGSEFHPDMVLFDVEKARAALAAAQPRPNYTPTTDPAMRPEVRPEGRYPGLATEQPRAAEQPRPEYRPEVRPQDVAARQPAPGGVQRVDFQRPEGQADQYAQRPGPYTEEAMRLFQMGEIAVDSGDYDRAMDFFRQAHNLRDGIDPALRQRIEDRLKFVPNLRNARVRQVNNQEEVQALPGGPSAPVANPQDLLAKSVQTDVLRAQYEARKLLETEPKKALSVLQEARAKVEGSQLDAAAKSSLTRRLDLTTSEVERTINTNRPRIELQERNASTRESLDRERAHKKESQEKLAELVEKYNKLMDEERFREAEVIARQAKQIAPEEQVVQSMLIQSRFVRNYTRAKDIEDAKAKGFELALESVNESGTPMDDRNPIQFDMKRWEQIKDLRKGADKLGRRQKSEKELEIQQKLKTPVSLRFAGKPLAEVIEYLGTLAQVNIHLDQRGLTEEGVTSNTPVTIDLNQPIMLKSALNLILEPMGLSFIIKNEVLQITSAQLRDGEVYPETYSVADLVIPIPNFVPNGKLGLSGAYADALNNMGSGARGAHSPVGVLASKDGGSKNAVLPPDMMAQFQGGGQSGPGYGPSPNQPTGSGGPGGMGGGVQADFDSLIELITSTIAPQSWDEVGGRGSVQPFETNLSLVISQTQQVHEQIADLLEQLRRLQDLQVTIEVRFITLNDNFFERIGVDFDFDIDDNAEKPYSVFGNLNADGSRNTQDRDHLNSTTTVGVQAATAGSPNFSSDLDVPFRQGSFALAIPQFGGFAPGAGATMGFAILSDIEAFFFIEASQGDRRSNVLQAPKVTLFNGQVAFVADTAQSPFVISVVPVVGDFAAAFQPVIVVLSEGTFLSVQAVVSSDRRFVRLTLVPFFSSIGKVDEFTFTGETTTKTSTGKSKNGNDDSEDEESTTETSRSGTTVQLPTFAFVTVTTTVSVPDGGTVLLGGIKRLSEGRNEFGVPILNKLPYVNRLFRNVGIGRETQSLMMMVTPRIIIQEEEEALLGVTN